MLLMSGRSPVEAPGGVDVEVRQLQSSANLGGLGRAGSPKMGRAWGFVYRIRADLGRCLTKVFGDAWEEIWVLETLAVAFGDFPCSFPVKAFLVEGPMKR